MVKHYNHSTLKNSLLVIRRQWKKRSVSLWGFYCISMGHCKLTKLIIGVVLKTSLKPACPSLME